MALSTNLAAAKAQLDAIDADTHRTTYNSPVVDALVLAVRKVLADVDTLNNA